MERAVLDDSIICLRKRCGQKLPGRKQGQDALFLFYCRRAAIYPGQIGIQCAVNGSHDACRLVIICYFPGQPCSSRISIFRHHVIGWHQPEPCIYFFIGHCCKGPAKCSADGHYGLSAGYSTTNAADENFQYSFFRRHPGRPAANGCIACRA